MSGRIFFAELKRRNVLRAAVLYAGAVWALSQGIAQLGPAVGLPDWATRWFLVAAIIGFPFWLAFAWFYEFTPDGLKRESEIDPADSVAHHTGKRLDRWIFAIMGLAIVLLLTDRFVLHHGVNEEVGFHAPDNSIAVLPFTDMSEKKDQEYFSDGISEDLLNLLTRIPQLQVTARTSSFSFKGKDIAIPEIARRLHVAHVLEGSVRKAGNTVRITAQLVDAASDTQLWSQSYDRKLDDVFAIQDEIAADVVRQLKVTLLGAAPTVRNTDPQAYALYLQAKQAINKRTREAFEQADRLLHEALKIDPGYAPAWNALATLYVREAGSGLLSGQEGFARARAAATKAVQIDPDYAPAYASLGEIAMYGDFDLAGSAKYIERAFSLDPSNRGVLGGSANLLESLGRIDEALAIDEAIVRSDPLSAISHSNLGTDQIWAGRFDEAIASFRTVLRLSPDRAGAHSQIGIALMLKGDAQLALAEIGQESDEFWRMVALPMAYHALGHKTDSDIALAALSAKYEREGPYNIASVHAFRGEADRTFTWLDKAIEFKDGGLSEIVSDNLFDKVRADPRWLLFLRKLGKAPEQLGKIQFNVKLPDAAMSGAAKP